MKEQEIFKVLSQYKKKLETQGYTVLYIGLYGSQNYNLDDELSDIDAKAIILPSLHDIIFRKVTSTTIECENGNIDVKDIITFYDVIKKGNFSYIECIDTKYFIGDKYLKELFRQFRPNLKSILGAMYEKRKALTHEYPSKHKEFSKWGFDPKQYHHIIRLYDLLEFIRVTGHYDSYLTYRGENKNFMIAEKRNKNNYTKEQVELCSDKLIESAKKNIPDDYTYEVINIDQEINEYIENKIKLSLIKKCDVAFARQYRTFDGEIPKKDIEKFPELEKYRGQDISYIVYESLEIL